MREVKALCEQMMDEIEGCKEYAISSMEYKMTRPELSNHLKRMAQQEYEHAQTLHDEIVKIVAELKASYANPPTDMLEKWEVIHKSAISMMVEAKVFLDLAK